MHSTGGRKAGDLFTLSGNDATHPVSCHYWIGKAGEVYQLVRDIDIAWHAGVCRQWNGKNVGNVSIGIELENLNRDNDPYPPEQIAAAVALVRAKLAEYALSTDRVIRHADYALPSGRRTDPVGLDWPTFLAALEPEPPTFTRRYRVTAGGATIRQAWWRTQTNIAGQLAPDTLIEVDSIHVGEVVSGEDLWHHLVSGEGFVHGGALERA